jgi:germination protein M
LDNPYEVTAQTAIYSVVNSLCELPSIDAVQISVEGHTDTIFRDTISLTGSFRMNTGIVESQQEEEREKE